WANQPGAAGAVAGGPPAAPESVEIVFRPDPTIYDGRFANNGWLQELPRPVTKLTWDNAVLMSPRTAEALHISYAPSPGHPGDNGGEHGQALVDMVEVAYRGRTLTAPVWVLPGHDDGAITIHLGYGRERAGKVGNGVGFDAYRLRTAEAPWFD